MEADTKPTAVLPENLRTLASGMRDMAAALRRLVEPSADVQRERLDAARLLELERTCQCFDFPAREE